MDTHQAGSSTSRVSRHTDSDEMFTVGEIAGRLKVSEETVRQWLRSGQIHGFNLGGRSGWRVRSSEIDRWLDQKAEQWQR